MNIIITAACAIIAVVASATGLIVSIIAGAIKKIEQVKHVGKDK